MKKRGEITLQFNWIYVLLIGAVVLIAVASIILNIKKQSSESFYVDAKTYITNFLYELQQNTGAERQLNMQGADLVFTCNDYSVKQSERSAVSTQYDPLFTPDLVSGTLIGYSSFLEIPMKTVSFLYATGPKVKYLIKDSDGARILDASLPPSMNKQFITSYNDFTRKDYDKIRYITFDSAPQLSGLGSSATMPDKSITLLQVEIIEDKDTFPNSYGRVTYYVKKNRVLDIEGEVYFIDKASLMAAIYSENSEDYYCNMDKAFQRLALVMAVEQDRLNEVSKFDNTGHCNYDNSKSLITQMQTISEGKSSQDSLHNIYTLKNKIKDEDRYLERISCPLMY